MYRGRLWAVRQLAGFGTAKETDERFRYLLDQGQTGLSTAFDMPSLMGYDSDDPRSQELAEMLAPVQTFGAASDLSTAPNPDYGEGDKRGRGIGDAAQPVPGAGGVVAAFANPAWVAEQPEIHLRPHVEAWCQRHQQLA